MWILSQTMTKLSPVDASHLSSLIGCIWRELKIKAKFFRKPKGHRIISLIKKKEKLVYLPHNEAWSFCLWCHCRKKMNERPGLDCLFKSLLIYAQFRRPNETTYCLPRHSDIQRTVLKRFGVQKESKGHHCLACGFMCDFILPQSCGDDICFNTGFQGIKCDATQHLRKRHRMRI